MESKVSDAKTSYHHHRKGSVKCGLKNKKNVPKGAPARKPQGHNVPLQNELEKVFAGIRLKQSTDDSTSETTAITAPIMKKDFGTLVRQFQKDEIKPVIKQKPLLQKQLLTTGHKYNNITKDRTFLSKQISETCSTEKDQKQKPILEPKPVLSLKPKAPGLSGSHNRNNTELKYNRAPYAPKKRQNNNSTSTANKHIPTISNAKTKEHFVPTAASLPIANISDTVDNDNNICNADSQTSTNINNLTNVNSNAGQIFSKAPPKPKQTSNNNNISSVSSDKNTQNHLNDKQISTLPPRQINSGVISDQNNQIASRLKKNISPKHQPSLLKHGTSHEYRTNDGDNSPPRKPARLFLCDENMETTEAKVERNNSDTSNVYDSVSESEWSDVELEKKKLHPISNSRHGSSSKQRIHSTERRNKWSKQSQIVRSKKTSVTEQESVICCDYEDVENKNNKEDSDKEDTDWETEDEYQLIDSSGYEIVEKAGWGPARMRKFRVSTKSNNNDTAPERRSKHSSSGSRPSSRRSSYYSDKDVVEIVPEPQSSSCDMVLNGSCQENNSVGTKEFNTLPLPPRQPKIVQRGQTDKRAKNPFLKEVPLPSPEEQDLNFIKPDTLPASFSSSNKPQLPAKCSSQKPKPLSSNANSSRPVPLTRKKKRDSKEVSLAVLRLSSGVGEHYIAPPPSVKCQADTPEGLNNGEPPPLMPKTYPKSPKVGRSKLSERTTSNIPEVHTSIDDSDIPNSIAPPLPASVRQGRRGSGTVNKVNKSLPEEVLSRPVGFSQTNKNGTLTVSIPPPRQPSLDGKYLKPGMNSHGYLPMDQQNKRGSYIDPEKDIDSVPSPPVNAQMPSSCMYSLEVPFSPVIPGTPAHDYLKLLNDDEDSTSDTSSMIDEDEAVYMFGEEPLYQLYHCGAVFRDVFQNDGQLMDDDSYGAIYESSETVRDYVKDILDRANSTEVVKANNASTKSDTPSSLETIVETGAGTRTLWAETKQVQESGLLDELSVEQKKIQEAIFEIITSEASYLKSLDLLLNHFLTAPEFNIKKPKEMCIAKREHQVLFSNIRKVRETSKKFLLLLEEHWKNNCLLSPGAVCKTITDAVPKGFEVYVKYCVNQTYQDRMLRYLSNLEKERKTNNIFPEALKRLEKNSACHGLTMQSFLTLPMQRVTRLPLLIDAACHRMDPNDPDYEIVTHCLSELQKLVKQCNEGAKVMDNIEQVNTIDRMLEFKSIKKIPIVSQSRCLVKKGSLTHLIHSSSGLFKKKKETLFLFLFNDLLLITKKKSDECFQVQNYAPRINVHADILTEDQVQKQYPGAPTGYKNMFLLVLLEKQTEFIFSCESTSDCTRWVEAVNPAQSQNADERIYESWDCPQVQVIHKYIPNQPDELSLEESDVINVFKKMADGWYEGERIRDGTKGWFPSNHVIEIQSQHVRAKNLKQRYRMLQMSNSQLASMFENPKLAWQKIDAS